MAKRNKKSTITVTTVVGMIVLIIALISHFADIDFDKIFEKTELRSNANTQGQMTVSFIDVGQGDCTLFTSGDYAVLVDGGESGEAQTVINYLKNQSIDDIDCMIATHPHSDHIGSLAQVMSEFEVKDVIMPEIPEKIIPTTSTYKKFLTAVGNKAENVIAAKAGETYSYGEINIEVFAPLNDYDDLNNMSVVARVSFGNTSVMMTGDAETASENDMLKMNIDYSADILKIGHHGSKTSTSKKWLEAVKPKYAVIMCGKGNDYGHPHKSLVSRLESHSVEFFRTDLLGNIVFESDGNTITKIN